MCGGEGCKGAASTSVVALNLARNVSDSLAAVNDELQSVTRKVQRCFFFFAGGDGEFSSCVAMTG